MDEIIESGRVVGRPLNEIAVDGARLVPHPTDAPHRGMSSRRCRSPRVLALALGAALLAGAGPGAPLAGTPAGPTGLDGAPGTFPPPAMRLTADPGASERPRVAIDGEGNAVVVWQDSRHGNYEILWQRFTLTGAPLTGVERLTQTGASSVRADVACGPRTSHVVWQEGQSSGVGQVMLTRRDLTGAASQWPVSVLDFSGHAKVAALANGEADVIMYRRMAADQDTYYRRYRMNGTYACGHRFAANAWYDVEKEPAIAVDGGGKAWMTWSDIGMWGDNQYLQATVGPTCVPAYGVIGGTALHSAIDIAGSRLERVFESSGRIHRMLSGGGSCPVSSLAGGSSYPSVATLEATSFAVWQDARTGNGDIYFCNYTDCTSLTGDVPLILSPGASAYPDIAVNRVNGEWVAVWQEDVSGNTEVFMTSSRLLTTPPTFSIAGATFDKQLYQNGAETATVSVVTQSFAGAGADLTLHVALDTNVMGHYDLGEASFTLAPGASRVSTFTWPVPVRDEPWDFSLTLELRQGTELVASVMVPKIAAGTPLSQAQIEQIVAHTTSSSCDPPITDCSMYLVGMIPVFGTVTDLVSFQSAACEVGQSWASGDYWQAATSTFEMLLTPVDLALGAIPGVSTWVKVLVGDAPGLFDCAKELFSKPSFGVRTSVQAVATIDSLAAKAAHALVASGRPHVCEFFAQGDVSLRVGVMDHWSTADTAAITRTFVFPELSPSLHWAHVGPTPVPAGSTLSNPLSSIQVRAVAATDGSVEFGFLHRVGPDSVAWIRYPAVPLLANSVVSIGLSDTSNVRALYVDRDADGRFEEYRLPDGTVATVSTEPARTRGYWLRSGLPNPSRWGTTFAFGLPAEAAIELGVHDAAGRLVRTLARGRFGAGDHAVSWDGTGEAGGTLPAGVYWVRLSGPWGVRSAKAVLVR